MGQKKSLWWLLTKLVPGLEEAEQRYLAQTEIEEAFWAWAEYDGRDDFYGKKVVEKGNSMAEAMGRIR